MALRTVVRAPGGVHAAAHSARIALGLTLTFAFAFAVTSVCCGPERARDPLAAPGAVVPLVPASARNTPDAAPRAPTASPLRVQRYAVRALDRLAHPAQLDASLLARARALDALDARITRRRDDTLLELTLRAASLLDLVREQLVRPGRFSLSVVDLACDPTVGLRALPAGGLRVSVPAAGLEHWQAALWAVSNPGTGIAPLEPLRALAARAQVPPGRRVLVGPVRERNRGPDNGVARRTWCVLEADAVRALVVEEARPTLDPRTLEPALELRIATDHRASLRALFAAARGRPVVAVIDDEVMGPAQVLEESDYFLRIVPLSRVGSVSPELVAALLRSGPHPVRIEVTELASSDYPASPPRVGAR